MKTWLVLDTHYLCHRAWHTAKELSWKGKATGVVFGFLKSISFLKDEFQTDRIAFCFESGYSIRKELYPDYKKKRHTKQLSPEEAKSLSELKGQIVQLYEQYLPTIGFKNVLCAHGYESDDVMARIAQDCPTDEEVILVTADSDLFQCLRPNVSIYSPQKRIVLTEEWFIKRYKIIPRQWAVVKAISGCISDEVKGIFRVGEITALSYLRGDLKPGTSYHNAIVSREGREIVRRNRKLVQLPMEGCPKQNLVEDQVDSKGWKEVCSALGMRSIVNHPPIATRKRSLLAK